MVYNDVTFSSCSEPSGHLLTQLREGRSRTKWVIQQGPKMLTCRCLAESPVTRRITCQLLAGLLCGAPREALGSRGAGTSQVGMLIVLDGWLLLVRPCRCACQVALWADELQVSENPTLRFSHVHMTCSVLWLVDLCLWLPVYSLGHLLECSPVPASFGTPFVNFLMEMQSPVTLALY